MDPADRDRDAVSLTVPRAGARGFVLIAVALALRWLILRPAPAPVMRWAPLIFVVCLGTVALAWQRRLSHVDSGPGKGPGRVPRGLVLLLCCLPAALSLGYVIIVGGTRHTSTSLALLASIALYVVATPVIEEYYFRHHLYREFSTFFGRPVTAIIANSVWFAAIHAPQNIPIALILGICCATLRSTTGTIYFCILAHATTNLVLELARF
jgi:membrane protease YdiL (CAAX protease family)